MSSLPLWDSSLLNAMFQVAVPVAEKILRPIVVYIFLVILLRIFGKRELAQLNPFDLVVLLSLSNTVQNSMIGADDSVTGGLIGATTLCMFNYLVVRFLFRHRRLDQLLQGKPTVLIENGHVSKRSLRRELMTRAELASLAHRQGYASLDEVDRCVLEPGGTVCIIGKQPREDIRRHGELVTRLDELTRHIEILRQQMIELGETRADETAARERAEQDDG